MGCLPDSWDGIVAGGDGVRDEVAEEVPADDPERHLPYAPCLVVQCEPHLWECGVVPRPEQASQAPHRKPIDVGVRRSVEELVGAWATECEHEWWVYRIPSYQPSTAGDDFFLATAGTFALDALPRSQVPS